MIRSGKGYSPAILQSASTSKFVAAGRKDNYIYGPCHGTGLIEVEAPWMETSSVYNLKENMTFQVDTFVSGLSYGMRWETGIAVRKGGYELLSRPIGKIYEIDDLGGRMTLKDIAEKTGYSIKTVSRAIHNHADINADTRTKIMTVVKEHSFELNWAAQSLRSRRTRTIRIRHTESHERLFRADRHGDRCILPKDRLHDPHWLHEQFLSK